jgi:hypothetical protein
MAIRLPPSIRTERIFIKFDIFKKSVQKNQVSLNSDNNNGYFMYSIFNISRRIILTIRNVADKICGEHPNIHFMSNNF